MFVSILFCNLVLFVCGLIKTTLLTYLLYISGNSLSTRVIEDLELAMLERHSNYYERALSISPSVWLTLMRNQTYRVQLDANFFLARYAFNLGCTSICGSCKRKITGRHFRCLNCINLDLCQVCFMEGKYPNHRCTKESHQIIEFSWVLFFNSLFDKSSPLNVSVVVSFRRLGIRLFRLRTIVSWYRNQSIDFQYIFITQCLNHGSIVLKLADFSLLINVHCHIHRVEIVVRKN